MEHLMAYAKYDFSRGRSFGNMTYVLLAIAVMVTLGLAGTIGSLQSSERNSIAPLQPYAGFTIKNTSPAASER